MLDLANLRAVKIGLLLKISLVIPLADVFVVSNVYERIIDQKRTEVDVMNRLRRILREAKQEELNHWIHVDLFSAAGLPGPHRALVEERSAD